MLEFEGLLFFVGLFSHEEWMWIWMWIPLGAKHHWRRFANRLALRHTSTPTHIRPESRHSLKHTYAHTHTNRWHRDTDQPQQQQQDAAEFEIRSTGLAVCSGGPVTRAYAVVFAYDLGCHHQGSGVAEGAVE